MSSVKLIKVASGWCVVVRSHIPAHSRSEWEQANLDLSAVVKKLASSWLMWCAASSSLNAHTSSLVGFPMLAARKATAVSTEFELGAEPWLPALFFLDFEGITGFKPTQNPWIRHKCRKRHIRHLKFTFDDKLVVLLGLSWEVGWKYGSRDSWTVPKCFPYSNTQFSDKILWSSYIEMIYTI